jgi:UTP--glucose-1-phosphate uridylyltransferase
MNQKVKKGVIPCAGLGTRFLPITKSFAKEMLPVLDMPVLQYIVQEMADSGVEQILIIINQAKHAIKHYFSEDRQLIQTLVKSNKLAEAQQLKDITSIAEICFQFQNTPKGSGDAVLIAQDFVGKQPFALAWGDDLIVGDGQPATQQLIGAFDQLGTSILGVQKILGDDIVKYGVPKISQNIDRMYKCEGIIEKPSLDIIPSRLAALGRYILTTDIFDAVKESQKHCSGELHLTIALNNLAKQDKLWAYDFAGTRFDMGDKLGYLKAIAFMGVKRFGDEFKNYIKKL